MTSPILDDLFNVRHRKKMAFAISEAGKLVDVRHVPNGLACNCKCPVCDASLVAKNNGEEKMPHFSHLAGQYSDACKHAGETALHRAAKEFLDLVKKLQLPEYSLAHESLTYTSPEQTWSFDSAILEKAIDQIVPDVLVSHGNRKLIVEFRVTHPCDEIKTERIRQLNISAIEIDLSAYRDRLVDTLAEEILYTAKRKWLHHAKEPEYRERLKERLRKEEEQEHQRLVDEASRLVSRLRELHLAGPRKSGKYQKNAREDGLAGFIGINLKGNASFSVQSEEWQSAILLGLAFGRQTPFSKEEALDALIQLGYAADDFQHIQDELVALIQESEIDFVRPLAAIDTYLRDSGAFEKIYWVEDQRWILKPEVRRRIEAARDMRKTILDRADELRRVVGSILGTLPIHEKDDFDVDDWMGKIIPSSTFTPVQATQFDEARWQSFLQQLLALKSSSWPADSSSIPLMGLPLESELQRRIVERRAETKRQDSEKKAKLEKEAEERIATLRTLSIQQLDHEHLHWLEEPNARLDNHSPLELARLSDSELARARHELTAFCSQLSQAARTKAEADNQVALLRAQLLSYCGDLETVELWMRGTNPKLGRRRPTEVCTNALGREDCLRVFQEEAKKRPKRR